MAQGHRAGAAPAAMPTTTRRSGRPIPHGRSAIQRAVRASKSTGAMFSGAGEKGRFLGSAEAMHVAAGTSFEREADRESRKVITCL